MLGFTLSKFSLLILVIAIFAIVSFFMLHLTESLKTKSLTDLLANDSTIASEMMSSPSYCDILLVKIPDSVKLSTSEMFYQMKISTKETTINAAKKTYLIFSAANKGSPEQSIAASSSPTLASVTFYKQASSGGIVSYETAESIILDPSARIADPLFADAFYLVKELRQNPENAAESEVVLYVFSCSVSAGPSNCENTLAAVGRAVHSSESVEGLKKFKCGEIIS